ncbi:MAG: hypothetical protein B6I38_11770 [Anaerolineaceae bacterium 4572_5.1]|nr:MAG: hypothetical protein B6I38_11770 [Anaerolineaceae bacterium 4572_5.1]
MTPEEIFYRRNLPHWHPKDRIFFITFRLANSLPKAILQKLRNERQKKQTSIESLATKNEQQRELYRLNKEYFGKYDTWLDRCLEGSPRWLGQESIARIVADEIHKMDEERYRLLVYCFMPNHVHLLFDATGFSQSSPTNLAGTTREYPLADTLRLLKGRTARWCNQALKRSGSFWHHESYDHVVRDEQELGRIIQYILYNPVKAGLVEEWTEWPFTYLAPGWGEW